MFTVKLSKSDFVSSEKWDEITESLELPEGREHVIVTRIPGLLPVEEGWKVDTSVPQPVEWLWADDAGGKRSFLVHTYHPRFIAEIIDNDEELHPPFEYITSCGEMLCNFNWIDAPPEDLTQLLNEAEIFLDEYY